MMRPSNQKDQTVQQKVYVVVEQEQSRRILKNTAYSDFSQRGVIYCHTKR